jgi:hypothetical protein
MCINYETQRALIAVTLCRILRSSFGPMVWFYKIFFPVIRAASGENGQRMMGGVQERGISGFC